ncbi:retrovirus-related Pol polyprotein from transposon TNT 1-94 [Trichonephila clavipes]|uniref:Retrovirus-related Pol polyprotein from transposon TNT 1-94 n=1 Tax=Trichonephila clavipes TaxID=2585209 RepID=A0A8X6W0S7_TRICX|nr:retrovirus-related Pol polyprotein from transposon TNT 1-94 [Trichonephila clavipes]
MAKEPVWFKNISPEVMDIYLADKNSKMMSQGTGNVSAKTVSTKHCNSINLTITDVSYVPQLRCNLLSVTCLMDKGCKIKSENNCVLIYDKNDKLITKAFKNNGRLEIKLEPMYNSECFISDQSTNNYEIWHNRLCHLNCKYMLKMKDYIDIDNVNNFTCETCDISKVTRKTHHSIDIYQSSQILELLHADLCGPINIESHGGAKYFMVIVDDFSGMYFTYFLKNKYEVFDIFSQFKAKYENLTDKRIKKIRTDNGLEFVNEQLDTYLANSGIFHEKTIPYNSESNGKAERANRVLLERARSLLYESKLPLKFWAEAINCSTQVSNVTPRKGKEKIPLEIWTGNKPKLNYLKKFGCVAYFHVPKVLRNKFEVPGRRGIMLGYARERRGYRIYDIKNQKVIEERSVKFNEYLKGSNYLGEIENETWDIDSFFEVSPERNEINQNTEKGVLYNFDIVSSINEQRPLAACKEKLQLTFTKNDKELVQSAIDYALAEIKNKRLDSEIKLEFERIKLAQLQKQLELANIQKNLPQNSDIRNPSVFETADNNNVETLLKSVKTLTIPVPSRVESYNLFFQSLEKAFKIKEVPEQFKCEILLNILADSKFNVPGKIDLLLGANIFYELLKPERIKIKDSQLLLVNSVFGYIVTGNLDAINETKVHCGLIRDEDLNKNLEKFWKLEEIQEPIVKNKERLICEEHYANTHFRTKEGKYVVSMPLKKEPSCLGNSKDIALKRLGSLWNRLARDDNYLNLYREFLRDYERLGHMKEVTNESEPKIAYYATHHGIYRPEKSTTKLRVVFNCSSLTDNGISLNDIQYNGGVIQEDLYAQMLRFRTYTYAFTADIKMMYRTILINPKQRNLQRIVWCESEHESPKIYELSTVTYGTVSAPYLAQRTLTQLSMDEEANFPIAASVLRNNCIWTMSFVVLQR